jgi:hypothetical protein
MGGHMGDALRKRKRSKKKKRNKKWKRIRWIRSILA